MLGCEHQRRVVVDITADFLRIVSGLDQMFRRARAAVGGGEVEIRVAPVVEVGVFKKLGMVAYNSLDEENIVQQDGSPQANARVDPRRTKSVNRTRTIGDRKTAHRILILPRSVSCS